MSTSFPEIPTLDEFLERLGGVPVARVRFDPLPGTATEQDLLDIDHRENRHCESLDGVLVEKPVGFEEAYIVADQD